MTIRVTAVITILAMSCLGSRVSAEPISFELLAKMPSKLEMLALHQSIQTPLESKGSLVESLLDQGKNSYANYRFDIANGAFRRVLAVEPTNIEANYYLGLMSVDSGASDKVNPLIDSLPIANAYRQRLVTYFDIHNQRSGEYQRAKLLARAGRYPLALDQYQTLFQTGIPTPDIALDYLIIQAKIDATKAQALIGLHQLNREFNKVPRYQLALADHIANNEDNYSLKRTIYSTHLNDSEFGKHAAKSWLSLISDLPESDALISDIAIIEAQFARDREVSTEAALLKSNLSAVVTQQQDPLYLGKRTAQQLYDRGSYQEAKAKIESLIQSRTIDDELMGLLGYVEAKLGNSQQSMIAFGKAATQAQDRKTRRDWQTLADESAYWTVIAMADSALTAEHYTDAQQGYSEAVTLLPQHSQGYIGLANTFYAQGKYASALESYRLALRYASSNRIALGGQFTSLLKLRGIDAALEHYATLLPEQQKLIEGLVHSAKVEQELDRFERALEQGNNEDARAVVERLLALQIDNPWVRRDIAQTLVSAGEEARASTMMKQWYNQSTDPDMAHAYSLYLSGLNRLTDAINVLNAVDVAHFSSSMNQTLLRLTLERRLDLIGTEYGINPDIANSKIQNLLSEYRTSPLLGHRILSQWYGLGENYRARIALQADVPLASDSTRIQLSYMGLLLDFDLWAEFDAISHEWGYPKASHLSPDQQAQWDQLYIDYQLAKAQRWQQQGNPQKAIALYQRVIKLSSVELFAVNVALLQAMIEYQGTTREALHLGDTLYERRQSIDAVDAMLLSTSLEKLGRRSESKLLLAELSQRKDTDQQRTADLLNIAVASRYWDLAPRLASKALIPEASVAPDNDTLYQAYVDAQQSELGQNIRRSIDNYQINSNVDIAMGYQASQNKSKNAINTVPIEINFPIEDVDGKFMARVDLIKVDSGNLSYVDYDNNQTEIPLQHKSSGYIAGLGFNGPTWSGDIGILQLGASPVLLGGVTLPFELGEVDLDLTLSRRPITSTVASYAGVTAPESSTHRHQSWGGVTKTGFTLGASYDQGGAWGSWLSAQAHQLEGENVEDNHRLALLGGVYYKVINSDSERLSISTNSLMMSYDNNQDEYSYGLGGYYSPQQYVSLSLPVYYANRLGSNMLFWSGAGISYSMVSDDGVVNTDDVSSTSQGVGYSADIGLESRLFKHWDLGVQLSAQHSEDYDPVELQLYGRYYIDPVWSGGDLIPNSVTRYADFN
jgi:tetratricopeptide (TPR) repeat protein